MDELEAVFQHGVFKPLTPVALPENQRVRLDIHPIAAADPEQWLNDVRAIQRRAVEQHGVYPDSAADIAVDRNR
jgi:predicted DNA-binding antitoxin AbrB/MazE fold protein